MVRPMYGWRDRDTLQCIRNACNAYTLSIARQFEMGPQLGLRGLLHLWFWG